MTGCDLALPTGNRKLIRIPHRPHDDFCSACLVAPHVPPGISRTRVSQSAICVPPAWSFVLERRTEQAPGGNARR